MTTKQLSIKIARELRKNQTDAEKKFWSYMRDRKFNDYKFLRQHPILFEYYGKERFFIADFYCREMHLVVEIDGGIHEEQEDYDQIRTEIMKIQKNLKVVRFRNDEVLINIDKVLSKLYHNIQLIKHS